MARPKPMGRKAGYGSSTRHYGRGGKNGKQSKS